MKTEHRNASTSPTGATAARGVGQIGRTWGRASKASTDAVLAQIRQRPVPMGLLLLGALAGGAVVLNPALRRSALASVMRIWRALRQDRSAPSPRLRKAPFPPAELVSPRAGG